MAQIWLEQRRKCVNQSKVGIVQKDAHAERHYLDVQPTSRFTFRWNLGEAHTFCEENSQPNSETAT